MSKFVMNTVRTFYVDVGAENPCRCTLCGNTEGLEVTCGGVLVLSELSVKRARDILDMSLLPGLIVFNIPQFSMCFCSYPPGLPPFPMTSAPAVEHWQCQLLSGLKLSSLDSLLS